MAGWEAVVHNLDGSWADGLLRPVRAMYGDFGDSQARDQLVEMAAVHVHVHDWPRLHRGGRRTATRAFARKLRTGNRPDRADGPRNRRRGPRRLPIQFCESKTRGVRSEVRH